MDGFARSGLTGAKTGAKTGTKSEQQVNRRAKVYFRLWQDDDAHPPVNRESVWAKQVEGGFVLDGIPFFTREATFGDLVAVLADGNGALWFDGIESASAHSLIRVFFFDDDCVASVRTFLEALGCATKRRKASKLVAVDVPPEADLSRIQAFLRYETELGRLDYEDALLRL